MDLAFPTQRNVIFFNQAVSPGDTIDGAIWRNTLTNVISFYDAAQGAWFPLSASRAAVSEIASIYDPTTKLVFTPEGGARIEVQGIPASGTDWNPA